MWAMPLELLRRITTLLLMIHANGMPNLMDHTSQRRRVFAPAQVDLAVVRTAGPKSRPSHAAQPAAA